VTYGISAWNVHTDEARDYGPFTFVQFTYDMIRVGLSDTDQDDNFGFFDGGDATWKFKDGFIASDFVVEAKDNGNQD